jgi:hypothetical protein
MSPDLQTPQPQSMALMPRSAKISMEEAAEAATNLASTTDGLTAGSKAAGYGGGASSRLPNGRPHLAIQST